MIDEGLKYRGNIQDSSLGADAKQINPNTHDQLCVFNRIALRAMLLNDQLMF